MFIEDDIFGRFLAEKCVCGRVCSAMSSELYSAYIIWFKNHDETSQNKPINVTAFGLILRKRGFFKVDGTKGVRWHGIALASEI